MAPRRRSQPEELVAQYSMSLASFDDLRRQDVLAKLR